MDGIEARVLTALRAAGLDPEQRLSPVELAALDHFHTGGFRASLALRDLAGVRSEDRVLDIGAGLAGPARMLAADPGCRVDCIDLSRDYCVAASLLNRLTGLEDRVAIHVGSALEIPFADGAFDVVWMQNVGMNIPDKPLLYREIRRVLKSGGRFAFQEMIAGDGPVTHRDPGLLG
jgi:ubiquinone/menaquinone biosynthesis C-methylase UbiE